MTNKSEHNMDRELAEVATKKALEAVKILNSIVLTDLFQNKIGNSLIKKGVGLSIGRIEMELLVPIFKIFPDLDDLKDSN